MFQVVFLAMGRQTHTHMCHPLYFEKWHPLGAVPVAEAIDTPVVDAVLYCGFVCL